MLDDDAEDFLDWKGGDKDDSIPGDRWDTSAWNGILMESPALENMIDRLKNDYNYVDDFGQDMFNLLHQGAPIVRSQAEMNPTHVPLRDATEEFSKAPEIESLQNLTRGDAFNAALALGANETALEEVLKRAAGLEEQAKAAQAAQKEAEDLQGQGDPGAGDAAQQAASLAASLGQASKAAAKASGKAIRQGVRDALQQIEETDALVTGFGGEPGEFQRMSFEERMKLAKRLRSGKLAKFAALLGRFRQLAEAEWRYRVIEGSDEVVGIKLGNDLTRLVSSEYINMAVPELEDDFWRRYSEGELVIKEMVGREREGKGPIVYLGDESASMSGGPEAWMKGLALALLDQARRGNRDFTYIGFAGTSSPLRVFHFPGGKADMAQTLDMAEGFLNGTTNFEKPIRMALDLITAAGKQKPDVVFCTDGGAPTISFLKEWREARGKLSVKCHAIFIGHTPQITGLTAMADTVRGIADVTDISAVGDILRT